MRLAIAPGKFNTVILLANLDNSGRPALTETTYLYESFDFLPGIQRGQACIFGRVVSAQPEESRDEQADKINAATRLMAGKAHLDF